MAAAARKKRRLGEPRSKRRPQKPDAARVNLPYFTRTTAYSGKELRKDFEIERLTKREFR
ncbi:hypothetical protein CHX27_01210 [Flavobacterium aurantiibacter]|uniref:Uncharacterized protein n=1 Tax=Flavobacterium aurantiibacter TaxID=2023067 RepID=A0A256A7L2_9FLAO|nr:hypothetical protein CHX27_01210 [Flavobacterium aurantiibacter]